MKYFQKFYYLASGLTAFLLYLTTIAPSVIQIDTGELATVQATLGIAHPTGYPLFTILGYLFSLIPLPFSKIFQLNLLAALYTAISVSVFTLSAKLIFDNISSFSFVKAIKQKSKQKKLAGNEILLNNSALEISNTTKIIASIFGGLFLAFSKTFWFQSTSVEVYSLHLLLMTLIIFFLLKAFLFAKKDAKIDKHWLWFSIVLALGFTNHMTTLLIIPGVAIFYFYQNKFNASSLKQILFMLLFFFPVLILIYSYLPIRASQNPIMNWGNPIDLERILRHISGQQYQVWLFASSEAAAKQFKYFFSNLPTEYSLTLIIVLLGLFYSFIRARKFFIFNFIVFISTVLYSINYDIVDIDSYFLLAYISLAFFAAFGVVQIILFAEQKKINFAVPVLLFTLILSIELYTNHKDVSQKDNFVYQDYTKTLLSTLPNNSIIFSYQWDYFVSASYYFQSVENFRKDITVIDKELLRRSWYYNQLLTNHPALLNGVKPEVDQFVEALKPFEREENFNANLLENLFRRIMTGLISTNVDKHDYFIAPELVDGEMRRGEFQMPQGLTLVPHLFLFKVVKTNEYVEAPLPNYNLKFGDRDDKYLTALKGFVSSMLIRRAMYELQFNKPERAIIYAKKLAADFPNIALPPALTNLKLN